MPCPRCRRAAAMRRDTRRSPQQRPSTAWRVALAARPARAGAAAPARAPSSSASASPKTPRQAPAERSRSAGLARHEGLERRVPAQLAARLGEQMHARREAARHQHRVAGEPPAAARPAAGDRSRARSPSTRRLPRGAKHRRRRRDRRCPAAARGVRQRAVGRVAAKIGDRARSRCPRPQIERGAIGRVVRGRRPRRACPTRTP